MASSRYGSRYEQYGDWAPYVPVAQRKRQAEQAAKRRLKKGKKVAPVNIVGRKIATTFWGTAWCDNLEHYSDYSNRLPRGRTYARNGSIVDLQISKGKVTAVVAGSSPYDVEITIKKLDSKRWNQAKKNCAKSIHSLIDLMRGKVPDDVLQRLTEARTGMFPAPKEIRLSCSCPDGARLCKHLAAVLYGVGHRLDSEPELFFLLRGVNQQELVSETLENESVNATLGLDEPNAIDDGDLESIFGIDLATSDSAANGKPKRKARKKSTNQVATKAAKKKVTKKKVATKKVAKKKVGKKAAEKTTKKKAVKEEPTRADAVKARKKAKATRKKAKSR